SRFTAGFEGSGGLQNGPQSFQRWASTFWPTETASRSTDTCAVISRYGLMNAKVDSDSGRQHEGGTSAYTTAVRDSLAGTTPRCEWLPVKGPPPEVVRGWSTAYSSHPVSCACSSNAASENSATTRRLISSIADTSLKRAAGSGGAGRSPCQRCRSSSATPRRRGESASAPKSQRRTSTARATSPGEGSGRVSL